ncbi:MAG TPA: ATP-binding cassette domain-containing protein [Candidatus Acidoferrales bacterium]|nr:ATP-binding cassette domain-containing protein [Candidatus Acidoferrales bacterium]
MTEDVIKVRDLTKKFGDLVAVDRISFSVKRGEIFGFLGPNGAGKSTAIKMLTTLLHPTSGSAEICGYDVVRDSDEVRRHIGIIFQDRSSDDYLTGRQNLDFHARMYGMNKEDRQSKMESVLDLLELKGKENIRLHNLPEGVRRRFEVARGFMTRPDVVFLDEPTIGFDIRARMDLWNQIKRAREQEGVSVSLTTHFIEEADYLCDRVAIIDKARMIALDMPQKLKASVGSDLISLQLANGGERRAAFIEKLQELDWIERVEEYSNSLLLSAERGEGRVANLIDFADTRGFVITSIDEHEPSLEDVFLHFTGRTIREAEGGQTRLEGNVRGVVR